MPGGVHGGSGLAGPGAGSMVRRSDIPPEPVPLREPATTMSHLMSLVWEPTAPPERREVAAVGLPSEAAALLRHEDGMTATLEQHWGEPMALTVLRADRVGATLRRAVMLSGRDSGRPTELGLIEIMLANLPPTITDKVVEGLIPFGSLLARAGISFRSRPHRFFSLTADGLLSRTLEVRPGTDLYGRETRLTDSTGRLLAEAVEIVSPLPR